MFVAAGEAQRVHELVEAQAARTPRATALVVGERRVGYAELDERADAIAALLRARGVATGSLVGVCLDRDEDLVAALLGVLKAGAAYVPLDPRYPAPRLRFLVEDSRMEGLLTSAAVRRRLELPDVPLALVEDARPSSPVHVPGYPSDPAYVIYTSGSTGRPKGVVVEHRNAVNLLRGEASFYSPAELAGVLAATSVCFDPSVSQLFLPLATGGTVILADHLLALHDLPALDRVTMVGGVPSALAELLNRPLPPSVRAVLSGGEPLSRPLADRILANPGVRRLVNVYGPTECTTRCAAEIVERDGRAPTLGQPYAGAHLSVRDAAGAVVDDGTVGQLWVAGPGVARGYLRRPELTLERFVSDASVPGGRRYATGDLVRRVSGRLEFLGRADDQVKIRGFRVELGEVEAALVAHPGIALAAAVAPADDEGRRRLVAYVQPVPGQAPTWSELRAHLQARVPDHLVPARVAMLDRLPVTPNGKLDRGALPPLDDTDAGGVPPRTRTEERVERIVAEVLGLRRVGVLDSFADVGGDSLSAARVVARVSEAFGVVVKLAEFLASPSVEGLTRCVESATEPLPVRATGRTSFPLTDLQRQMWTMRQLAPDSAATTIAVRVRMTGLPGIPPLQAALDAVVRRHDVLRTTFSDSAGGPLAVVRPPAPVPVEERDLRPLPAEERATVADGVARRAAEHVFDLATEVPLLRASVAWTGADTADVVLTADHCAFDGYSSGLLLTELTAGVEDALARRPDRGEPPALQVGDLALYESRLLERPGELERLRGFWRSELDEVTPPNLFRSPAPTVRRHRGDRAGRPIGEALAGRLSVLAADLGVSSFTLYLAALGVVLGRATGRSDTVVGVASARRDLPGTAAVIGPLVRVVPVRVPTTAASYRGLARDVAAATARSLAHQDLPAAELAACTDAGGDPGGLTPVLLSVQPDGTSVSTGTGAVRTERLGQIGAGGAVGDLSVLVSRTVSGLQVHAEYDVDRCSGEEAESLLDRYLEVLERMTTEPDSQVVPVDDADRRELLRIGSGALLPVGGPRTVVEAVLAQARRTPHSTAVSDDEGSVDYAALASWSERVAHGLVRTGVRPGDVVGACLPRDRHLSATLLGIWRAGAAYVPLDPEHPAERMGDMLATAGARMVLAAGSTLSAARAVPGVRPCDVATLPDSPVALPLPRPAATAYVLFTSGSTGRPKGVEVTHENLAALVAAMLVEPGYAPEDVVPAITSMSFDVAASELWVPLACGARSVVVDRADVVDAHRLAERLARCGATVLDAPPTLLRTLLAVGWRGDPGLRVVTGGEAVDPALARELLPSVLELWNAYGPTETTVNATMHRITSAEGPTVPIGRPIAGTHAYVVDPDGNLLPRGAVGELWLGGAGVARGYAGPQHSGAAAFLPDPFRPGGSCYRTGDLVRWLPDGTLDFAGRQDAQVKIRGQRIELGEIESVLREHADVVDAAVRVHGTGIEAQLVGYAIPASLDAAALEALCRRRLPEYMVPRQWVALDVLPTLPSGKVDRRALPEPARVARGVPPRTATERLVAAVWAEVLGVAGLGVDDSFFALGGQSFAATRVVARLREALGCRVPVRALFEHPVLADFTTHLERLAIEELDRQFPATPSTTSATPATEDQP